VTEDAETRRTAAALLLMCNYFAAQLKVPLAEHLAPEERITARLPDGTKLGTVTLTKPPRDVIVYDEAALLAWVTEHRPDEITRAIRPAYLKRLKELCRDDGLAYDERTGEVIPGIELGHKEPRLYPRLDHDTAPELLRPLLARLVEHGRLELPPSGDGTPPKENA
jgi:hypothetical protein